MSIQLPSELTAFLSVLGFDWPDADEEKLNDMGRTWVAFSRTLNGLNAEATRHAEAVWTGNRGTAISAFQDSWMGAEAPIANLRLGAEGAALIGAGFSTAAGIVVTLKRAMIAAVFRFSQVCYTAARIAKTPWTAVLGVGMVVAARVAAVMAINTAIDVAVKALLNG